MNVLSGSPVVQLAGINDLSIRTPLPEGEALPMHLPFLVIPAERGPETTQLVGGNDALRMFGSKSFDLGKEYVNHATMMFSTINARGNLCMLKRYIPSGAKRATLRVSLEFVKADIPVYERDDFGKIKLDAQGAPIPADGDPTVEGYKARWLVGVINGDYAQANSTAGTLAGKDGETSTIIPWFDYEVTHHGGYGNNVGLSLAVPTTESNAPVDETVVADNGAMMWRLQFVERADATSSPVVQQTLVGGQSVDFMLKTGAVNKALARNIHMDKVVPKAYRDVDSKGFAPIYGPMDNYHFYKAEAENALKKFAEAEAAVNAMVSADDIHAFNPLGGVDVSDVEYETFQVLGTADGGALMGEGIYHYAQGGEDGDLSLTAFDAGVRQIFENFDNDPVDIFMDSAEFPFSCFYDSGFSIDTKKAMLKPIGLRKDVYTVLSTQDVTRPQNTAAEELSMAIALRAAARLYPESTHYGTSTCRAMIVGHSGKLLNSEYDGLLPLTIDFANKCAGYMGAAAGSMKEAESIDTAPNNNVTMFRDVNCLYKNPRLRQQDWAAGLVWAQRKDRHDFFYPAYQTVYDNDTSVINAAINMFIAVELEKVAERVWRNLTGDSKLTDEQFFDKSNRMIERYTRGRFDGRVVIRAETYKTEEDRLRGYSWSCNITMYANNMRTVGSFTITAQRREDLAA